MKYSAFILRGVAASALLFATASPAFAQSQTDRARMAISEAQAKVDAAIKVGATTEAPRELAQAQAALRTAQEDLARSRELASIDDANQASAFADQALGITERRKSQAAAATREDRADANATAAAAQQDAAAANARADAAQADAANANARADAATADAAVARSQPPIVIAAPAPPTTTVTTTESVRTTPAARPAPAKRRVVTRRTRTPAASVRRPAPSTTTRTTTTTVKTN